MNEYRCYLVEVDGETISYLGPCWGQNRVEALADAQLRYGSSQHYFLS